MSSEKKTKSTHRRWAEFRFSVIGRLLASPPKTGELAVEFKCLSEKTWRHPLTNTDFRIGLSTIEGWYYTAKNEKRDPLGQLRSKPRSDAGKTRCITGEVEKLIKKQYAEHPSWTYQLHADNLTAKLRQVGDVSLKPPSYPTVRRFMKGNGLCKQRRPRNKTDLVAIQRRETYEIRSFEAEYVNALWHLDFHKCPRKVVTEEGIWVTPTVLGIFDDHSRLACHMQWYYSESSENLIHAFSQAVLKRALPRENGSDNGAAMTSAEFTEGLTRLSITPRLILPYSPYQNGKCEFVWNKVDGRLMAMLESYPNLTLTVLNDVTQAWVEMEYNRQVHRETDERPIDRYLNGKNVGRPSPSPENLRLVFRREERRTQRRSDGTISLENQRFEIPSPFRHIEKVTVRYASWDLSFVHLVDFRTGDEIARLYPVDKVKNADGRRRIHVEPVLIAPQLSTDDADPTLPPLLQDLVDEYGALGLRPAYLPQSRKEPSDEQL